MVFPPGHEMKLWNEMTSLLPGLSATFMVIDIQDQDNVSILLPPKCLHHSQQGKGPTCVYMILWTVVDITYTDHSAFTISEIAVKVSIHP